MNVSLSDKKFSPRSAPSTRRFWPLLLVTFATFLPQTRAQDPRPSPLDLAFLRDHIATRGFLSGRPVSPQFTKDGQKVYFLRAQPRSPSQGLFELDVATGNTREATTPQTLLQQQDEQLSPEEKARRERMRVSVGGFTGFQFHPDGRRLLLPLSGKLFLWDRFTQRSEELPIPGPILDPKFSPDGLSIAYVRNHDVWRYSLKNRRESPVTRGGSERLSHGDAEFVAQEEMNRFSGYWWSPDSQSILYQESDAAGVEVWHISDPARPENAAQPQFYPRPGKANVHVRLGIIPARGGRTRWIRWDSERLPYFANAVWDAHGGLLLTVQSRDQKELQLLRVDPRTGTTHLVLQENDPAWVNLDLKVPRWIQNGAAFLWTTERSGAWQLELHKPNGNLERVLAGPDHGFREFIQISEDSKRLWFLGGKNPSESHVYELTLASKSVRPVTQSPGVHTAVFHPPTGRAVLSSAAPDAMPSSRLLQPDLAPSFDLPATAENPRTEVRSEFLRVGPGEGFYAAVIRPHDFSPNKKYPVIVSVYGGPHVNTVIASKANYLLPQWLADQGFIVVAIDGRGTPKRGRAWERAIQGKLGPVPLDDQAAGLQALCQRFPELDASRVGITGWSFGGYMSAMAVLRKPDVFHAAVAGAPVTDWYDYDTHYTERYLGVPPRADPAYRDSSLLDVSQGLRRPLLLIHGTSDDNVFFRHSLRLADALFRAGQPVDLIPLGGLTHMVRDPVALEQRWLRTRDYFVRHLGVPR